MTFLIAIKLWLIFNELALLAYLNMVPMCGTDSINANQNDCRSE